MTGKRLPWVDSIKGFAALCVVLNHVLRGYLETSAFLEYHPYMEIVFRFIDVFYMPLFFTVSGFLFRKAYVAADSGTFVLKPEKYQKQLLNLVILYIVYSLLLGSLKIVFSEAVNNKVKIQDLGMIWIRPIQLYWYIYVLILLYLTFPAVTAVRIGRRGVLCAAGALSVASGYLPGIAWFDATKLLFYGFYFYLGVYLDELEKTRGFAKGKPALFVVAVGLYIYYMIKTPDVIALPLVRFLLAAGVTLLLIILFQKRGDRQSRLLILLGKYSLEIYLLHTYVATAARTFFPQMGLTNFYATIPLALVLSVSIPILIAFAAKKMKLHGLMFKPAYQLPGRKKKASQA